MCATRSEPTPASGSCGLPERRDDTRLLAWALLAAAGLHLVFFFVDLPENPVEFRPAVDEDRGITLQPLDLPPPPVAERPFPELGPRAAPRTPVPVPTAAPAEPVPERTSTADPEAWTAELPVLIESVDRPPAPPTPLIPGVDDVTRPVLIAESKVQPVYPEVARYVRLEGRVILQAVIGRDGAVSEVEVLACDRPDVGFEQAAIEAVKQWRYEPARQFGVPVDVFFTVVVEFELQ